MTIWHGLPLRIVAVLLDDRLLSEAYSLRTFFVDLQCPDYMALKAICRTQEMRKAWLMRQSFVSHVDSEDQILLLCMTCLFYSPLHIFQRTLGRGDGKQHLGSLLLNHCNVINDCFVTRLQMQSLWT